ncbi:glucose-methanol-choline oxidoreductase [Mycobacterium antarcticum]|uniref:mycofactocin dehydrogenase MftG n=1 Tax=unclassified Mycolicibacterium TaxID=2636767 RepID=UPI002390C2D3|nr:MULTISPECIES: mycofactocin system GMC family oxidoreductase MftG [unclassified Mycolicibacterium]BDX34159.1 glucose-methanol-choline oxidoreductase [Mycolicibacterium sp. TUM20985]GLP77360.1 glucose-methanol-choline oxidoreductase [Mycolicibacterium sp. TUM20983]
MHSDVLIVGAGSAGCVLAESLSRDPRCRVTIVESGPGRSDPGVREQIDDGHRLPIGVASSVVRRYQTTLTESPRRSASLVRGDVVGGSGAVNGGYFCRGLASDFDEWGIPGWTWNDVLPHFREIETDLDFDGSLHGADGPMVIRRTAEFNQGASAFIDAALRHGYGWVADLNGADPGRPGVGAVPLNINGGTRVGPGDAFLDRAAGRANLTVLEKRRATRIEMVRHRAVGVDCVGSDGPQRFTADRIVLSAGAIGSAQLLMVSGVGPASQLSAAGVPVLLDLPVGTASIDHPELVLPVDWPAAPDRPPLEVLLTTEDSLEIRCYTTGFASMTGAGYDPADRPHLGVTLMRPHSRGRVVLASGDAAVPPSIEHRYDSEPADVAALEAGAALAHDLAGSGYEARESFWSTSQHLCGTVPMGRDGEGALDERCRVRGVEGLWVVDGSILPDITSRGPHATIAMIGHRAAEFIR